jgi:hypothetical protein
MAGHLRTTASFHTPERGPSRMVLSLPKEYVERIEGSFDPE